MPTETFDATKPLVVASATLINGFELTGGLPVRIVDKESEEPAELTAEQAERLLQRGTLVYADRAFATPVESPEAYAGRVTVVEPLDNGKFLIRAPWLGEGEVVEAGKVADRTQEVVEQGVARHRELIDDIGSAAAAIVLTGQDGFTMTDLGSGYYGIMGPGISEPEKVRGKDNADSRLNELRAAAATEATTAPVVQPGAATAEVPTGAGTDQAVVDVTAPPAQDAAAGTAPTE